MKISFASLFDPDGAPSASMLQARALMRKESGRTLHLPISLDLSRQGASLIIYANQAAGFVEFHTYPSESMYEVHKLYIAEDFRRMGIARAVVQLLLEGALRDGATLAGFQLLDSPEALPFWKSFARGKTITEYGDSYTFPLV